MSSWTDCRDMPAQFLKRRFLLNLQKSSVAERHLCLLHQEIIKKTKNTMNRNDILCLRAIFDCSMSLIFVYLKID